MRSVLAILLLSVTLAWGCGREGGGAPEPGAWIAEARRAHAAADEAVAQGDLDAAREALRGALEREAPAGVAAEDRRVVRQDLAYRLAQVELSAERPAEALRWAERGLEEGRAQDVFTANLLVARGRAHEALGDDRRAAGDYFEALEINEALLRRTLDEGTPPEEP